MDIKNSVLETIGNTPMVKLNKVIDDIPCMVLGKIETFNPGHSTKDRMALKMVEDAEHAGKIKPGGTIIECTSGNTGMGIALAAVVKGYKCIFTTSDKQSKEKIDILKALGAEVIVCPTNVEPDDPRSYYSVAEKLSKELPNSVWLNQYDNLANRQAHYESTGPEIWRQTDGKVTHFVVGVGTGGTISGIAKYLKEKNPNIKIWGIDTYGSVFKKYHETGVFDKKEIYPYITEGIGEDILPKNVDFSLIDHFEKVTDKDAAIAARRLAREEGLLLGYSAGSALAGLHQLKSQLKPSDVVVILFHDHGSRYVGKIYNDDWMRERGFLDTALKVSQLVEKRKGNTFIFADKEERIADILTKMKTFDISQLPVMDHGEQIGSVTENNLLEYMLIDPTTHGLQPVAQVMGEKFPEVPLDLPVKELHNYLTKSLKAVICYDRTGNPIVLTSYDIVQSL